MSSNGKRVTRKRLVEAVGDVLAKEGFRGLGINRVAREAGVDKVLIYRYFGGLHELVSEYSKSIEFWPSLEELLGPDEQMVRTYSAEEQFAFFFKSFLHALRKRPKTQMIMTWWDSSENSEFSEQLDDIRMRRALEFFERLEKIPVEPDLTAVVTILYAAISKLIEKSQLTGFFGGLDLNDDADWKRIEDGIDQLTRGLFLKQT